MAKSPKRTEVPAAIKAELASLNPGQLEAVAKLAASLAGGQFVPKAKVVRAETGGQHARAEAFFEALSDQMYQKTRSRPKPLQLLLSSQDKLAKTFLEKHKEYDVFLDHATGQHQLTEAERLKFYTFGANLLASALVKAHVTFNMNTIVNWITNAPSLFNQQFPGYIESGLLHVVVNASLQSKIAGHKGSVVEVRAEEVGAPPKGRAAMRARIHQRRTAERRAQYTPSES